MNLKNRILIILAFCLLVNIGAYLIISNIFQSLEDQFFEKCRNEALAGSRVMGVYLEKLLDEKRLTIDQLFDTTYKKIPGTAPQKYTTSYDAVFDREIQDIQDAFLIDPDFDYAVLIDRNGYVPTHNRKYSRQAINNKADNTKYNRSKRIFSHYPSIKKSIDYTGNETIKSLYNRDTGETMWNVAAPVTIKGKRWGSFLIGVSLTRTEVIKNQMMILTISIMFIIMIITVLLFAAVIPRKVLASDLNVRQ